MQQDNQNLESNSLETTDGVQSSASVNDDVIKVKTSLWSKIVKKLSFMNIYLLLFLLIVVLAVVITYIGIRNNRKVDNTGKIDAQDLTNQAASDISANNTQIGDPKETLTIASNSIFNGKVLFRDGIDVAGAIRVGGSLSLAGITVSGNSNFETVSVANNLSIGGDTSVNGNLSVQKSLTVSGGASFGGAISAAQLNIDRLTLNQDILLNRHITTGGGVPGVSTGPAAGGGATTSISGSDTAGTVTINTGGGTGGGVLASITFANSFGKDPHVVVTPVGSSAGNLSWFITRIGNGFTISTNNAPAAAASFSFDFVVIN